jgi:hypothetical protein
VDELVGGAADDDGGRSGLALAAVGLVVPVLALAAVRLGLLGLGVAAVDGRSRLDLDVGRLDGAGLAGLCGRQC